jgi:hypothetical protein
MFNFEFTEPGKGKITIDDFQECFESEHTYWSKQQYESQWVEARNNLLDGKASMFITSITDPENANFIRAWVGYPKRNKIIFQEHIVFVDKLKNPFNPQDPHASINKYTNKTEEGEAISEWETNAE